MKRSAACILLICTILFSTIVGLTACGTKEVINGNGNGNGMSTSGTINSGSAEGPIDMMEGTEVDITISDDQFKKALEGEGSAYVANLAASLIKTCSKKGENTLISPLSIIYALAMTANGAVGETRYQLLEALTEGEWTGAVKCGTSSTGVGDIWDEKQANLNNFLRAYLNLINTSQDRLEYNEEEGICEMHIANSIWFKDVPSLNVEKDFLKINGEYYDAGIMRAAFDEATRLSINSWIEENTEGMIKDMLKEIKDEDIMYLVNAMAFEGAWAEPFEEYQLQERTFHGESGDGEAPVQFMNGADHTYIEDDKASGFLKYYVGWDYAFVGILPNEDVSLDEYIDSLDGTRIRHMINSAWEGQEVIYSMPKFEEKSSLSLVETFESLGLTVPFDGDNADFSKMGTSANGNIYIGDIFHDTFIDVNEDGTRAVAATIVATDENAMEEPEPPKEVILDRPFLYMLVDVRQGIPLFIGTIRNL